MLGATTACTLSTSGLHLDVHKWPEHVVFCAFSLPHVRPATTACTFSTSQLPKMVRDQRLLTLFTFKCASCLMVCTFSASQLPTVVREWCVLTLFTPKCASRHNGVQFFIFHLASWLRTRRFSEPTCRPSGATRHWKKHSVWRLCYLFAHLHLLSSDFLHL